MNKTIDVSHGDGTTSSLVVPSTPFGNTYSTEVDELLGQTTDAGILQSFGLNEHGGKSGDTTAFFASGLYQSNKSSIITNSSGFYQNTTLTSVEIGSNVTSIGTGAFFNCQNLTSVTLGNNVTSLGQYCLRTTGITSINIPDSVTSIGYGAFDGTPITSATFGVNSGITAISGNAFYGTSLTSFTIPASVTSIAYYAFAFSNSLSRLECLALTAPTASSGAFYYTAALSQIHVPAAATGYGSTLGGLTVVADL